MFEDVGSLIVFFACFAVLVVLLMGINSFRKEGKESRSRSNILMQWRIGLQVVAVIIILIFVALRQQSGG